MPITEMYFEDGIFFAREVGRIERDDARYWAEQISYFAAISPTPIVSLVDALEVTFVTTEARQIFVRMSKIPNLKLAAVAAAEGITAQTARVIGKLAQDNHTHVFPTLEEATRFAKAQVEAAETG